MNGIDISKYDYLLKESMGKEREDIHYSGGTTGAYEEPLPEKVPQERKHRRDRVHYRNNYKDKYLKQRNYCKTTNIKRQISETGEEYLTRRGQLSRRRLRKQYKNIANREIRRLGIDIGITNGQEYKKHYSLRWLR